MSKYANSYVDLSNLDSSWTKIYNLINKDSDVLDFGCSTGFFSRLLQQNKSCRVTGIEIDKNDSIEARKFLHEVITCNAEQITWTKKLEGKTFDVILLGDFLEHLYSPTRVLRATIPFIRQNGYLLISVPNIAHISVRLRLLQGNFLYEKTGIMDRNHLRFFTLSSIERLPSDCLVQIFYLDATRNKSKEKNIQRFKSNLPPFLQSELQTIGSLSYQYIILGRPMKKDLKIERIWAICSSFFDMGALSIRVEEKNIVDSQGRKWMKVGSKFITYLR